MAKNSPIDREQWFIGAAYSLRVKIVDSTGSPQNLIGMTLTYRLRQTATTAALITKATGSGITLASEDGTNDVAVVAIAAADTQALTEGNYVDALVRTDAGSETVLMFGDVYLSKAA